METQINYVDRNEQFFGKVIWGSIEREAYNQLLTVKKRRFSKNQPVTLN